jgi:hypothetical protein
MMAKSRRKFLTHGSLGLMGVVGMRDEFLLGRLFEEGALGRAGIAVERAFHVAEERPALF